MNLKRPARMGRPLFKVEVARMLRARDGREISIDQFRDAISERRRPQYSTVTMWCRSGWLPATKLGRDWMIDPQQLDGWRFPMVGQPTKEREGA